jgi:hypothetical protein
MTRTAPCFRPPQPGANDLTEVRCVTEWNKPMKCKNGNSEREYQDRLEILRKSAFNTKLEPLRSLETATKKRRALKKRAAGNSGFTKSTSTISG